jgi:hypothetical protein
VGANGTEFQTDINVTGSFMPAGFDKLSVISIYHDPTKHFYPLSLVCGGEVVKCSISWEMCLMLFKYMWRRFTRFAKAFEL